MIFMKLLGKNGKRAQQLGVVWLMGKGSDSIASHSSSPSLKDKLGRRKEDELL